MINMTLICHVVKCHVIVEQGGNPMNFFREEPDDILYGSGSPPEGWTSPDWAKQQLSMRQGYRTMYHKGFVLDDVDRYGEFAATM